MFNIKATIVTTVSALLISILFGAFVPAPSQATPPPSIVVIDTGTNIFQKSIVTEVCIIERYLCANGKNYMEGLGAATIPKSTNKALNHGSQMISVILAINPDVKIIPIRIVGVTDSGIVDIYSLRPVKTALDWVIANAQKYNIAAVNISQGSIQANCAVPDGMKEQVLALKQLNIPIIAATGNLQNRKAVNSPACINDVVSVGATDNTSIDGRTAYDINAVPTIARYSNGSKETDFYLNGRWYVTNIDGSRTFTAGTSNATATLSAYWVLNLKSSFDETYNFLLAKTIPTNNQWLSGKYLSTGYISIL